jgi:hypothetical protein
MIVVYTLIVLILRMFLTCLPDDDGRLGEVEGLFSSVCDDLTPYIALVVWVMYPLSYFAMIAQRLVINWGSLLKPRGTVEDHIRDL